jgi:predicted nucleic acid-binding protein
LSAAKNKTDRFVLDTFAILTYLKEEPGWKKIRDLLWNAFKKKTIIFLNYVSLGEFYYIVYRESGAVIADKAASMVKLWPVRFVSVREDLAIIAGRMKAENKISYADAYVAATALNKQAVIVTGDKEFKSLEELMAIFWLPENH